MADLSLSASEDGNNKIWRIWFRSKRELVPANSTHCTFLQSRDREEAVTPQVFKMHMQRTLHLTKK